MHAKEQLRILLDQAQWEAFAPRCEARHASEVLFPLDSDAGLDLGELQVDDGLQRHTVFAENLEIVVAAVPQDFLGSWIGENAEQGLDVGSVDPECEDVEHKYMFCSLCADAHEGEGAVESAYVSPFTVDDEDG